MVNAIGNNEEILQIKINVGDRSQSDLCAECRGAAPVHSVLRLRYGMCNTWHSVLRLQCGICSTCHGVQTL